MNIKQTQEAEKFRRWRNITMYIGIPAVLIASLLFIATGTHSPQVSADPDESALLAQAIEMAKADQKISDLQLQNRAAEKEVELLTEKLAMLELTPTERRTEVEAMSMAAVDQRTERRPVFILSRDTSIPLVDQLNNPGGLSIEGSRSIRFGAEGEYLGHAYFPSRVNGVAALLDLITAHQGATIEQYIMGGGPVKKWESYTGGVGKDGPEYLSVFQRNGIKKDQKIYLNYMFLLKMLNSHAQMEGSDLPVTEAEFVKASQLRDEIQASRAQ